MYDTSIELTLEGILSKTTEYDIYRYYLTDGFTIGKVMKSPFRQDKNPSFGIFKSSQTGQLLFKDQATGQTGNCIDFVRAMENCTYKAALVKILKNINKGSLKISTKGIDIQESYKTTSKAISFIRRNFCQSDDNYWMQYYINRDDLKYFKIFPISEYWINGIVQPWGYKASNPGYVYMIYNKVKIYKPLESKKNKWITNCSNYDIQGYEQLPYKGDLVVITKSLKDVIVLYKLGYNAVAPQGENHTIPKEVIADLKKRFTKIVLLYDNDEAGFKGSAKLRDKYSIPEIFIPDIQFKDISDYVKANGLERGKELVNNLLNSIEHGN